MITKKSLLILDGYLSFTALPHDTWPVETPASGKTKGLLRFVSDAHVLCPIDSRDCCVLCPIDRGLLRAVSDTHRGLLRVVSYKQWGLLRAVSDRRRWTVACCVR